MYAPTLTLTLNPTLTSVDNVWWGPVTNPNPNPNPNTSVDNVWWGPVNVKLQEKSFMLNRE